MGRRVPIKQLLEMEFTSVPLPEKWRDALGDIEDSFQILIYGDSGNGKTSFTMPFLDAIADLGSIVYITWEEAISKSVKKAVMRSELAKREGGIIFSDGETFEEIDAMCNKKGGPKTIVFDSIDYSGITYEQYCILKKKYLFGKTKKRRKIFVIISHSSGTVPKSSVGKKIRYDAMIKVYVKKFIAFITSRFENSRNYVIDEEKARAYYKDDFENMTYLSGAAPKKKPRRTPVKKVKKDTPPPPSLPDQSPGQAMGNREHPPVKIELAEGPLERVSFVEPIKTEQ